MKEMSMVTSPLLTAVSMTRRSSSSFRANEALVPFTVTEWMSNSMAFSTISETASTAVAAMETVPVNEAFSRSGTSDTW